MSAIVVIPARYASTRFPGKPLALLKGMPLIQHVYQNSLNARLAGEVIVATDSETIFAPYCFFEGEYTGMNRARLLSSGISRLRRCGTTALPDVSSANASRINVIASFIPTARRTSSAVRIRIVFIVSPDWSISVKLAPLYGVAPHD